MSTDDLDAARFATAFQTFLERWNEALPATGTGLAALVAEHLGADPSHLPTSTEQLHPSDHPNLQLALDRLATDQANWHLVGLPTELLHVHEFSLASVLAGRFRGRVQPCPPEYLHLPVGVDETLPCLRLGLYLGREGGSPLVVLLGLGDSHGPRSGLRVDVMAATDGVAAAFLARLRSLMRQLDVYRGKILSFSFTEYGSFGVTFHRLPPIRREDVILPDEDLVAIERHIIGISRHADALRASGRHLKRGLLLYGPPGTGKTLSVMYLCGAMPGRTTVLVSGQAAGALGQATAIARALQPSTVVLEDVDLVAMERTMPGMGTNPLLFQLLNEMDGMAEDADVAFVLTTNRVELLEPALAARPGRIDQAVEIRLPDEACRRRLLELYLRGVPTDSAGLDEIVTRTAGVTASFVKELVRRAVLRRVEVGGEASTPLTAADLHAALDDLLEHSPPVLRSSLGVNPGVAADASPAPAGGGWFNYAPDSGPGISFGR